jgi:hypothetical protein
LSNLATAFSKDTVSEARTPAAVYCFLSQTPESGLKMDEGLVATPICTGGAT